MTVNKKLGKFLTLVMALLLSVVVLVLMQAYVGDSRFKFSYMIKPSVDGVYDIAVHYTDERDIEVKLDDKAHTVEKRGQHLSNTDFTTVRFVALNRPNHQLQKVLLRIKPRSKVPNGTVITVKKLAVNHHRVRALYETQNVPGRTIINKCNTDSCEPKINDEYQLKFKDNVASLYLNSNLSIRPQLVNLANFGTLIVLIISTSIIYLLLRFLLNTRKKRTGSSFRSYFYCSDLTYHLYSGNLNKFKE